MPQPLTGLLVLDFTTLLPGPLATLMLAEAGAQVIKIERPGGEDMRRFAPFWEGEGAAFTLLNRGKSSLVVDLKSDGGQTELKQLLQKTDILVEQFRPKVMKRLGFDYESIRSINPRLIYCSISGYGQTGPRSGEAGHDLNYIGNTGLLSLQPGPSDRPVVPPALVADIGGGTFPAVINILLALRQREQTGEGCHLDIAMSDAMFTFAWHALAEGFVTGRYPENGSSKLAGGSPRYQLYPTYDGKFVACGALEDHFWSAFTAAIALDQSLKDDGKNPRATQDAIAAIIAEKTAAQWRPILAATDCCATVVASLKEATGDPHFIGRGLFSATISAPSGATIPALPVPIAPEFRGGSGGTKPLCRLDGS